MDLRHGADHAHSQPLPFQDLEPKRFEDLVRQLLYDFRPWRVLEATGRGGSDDGFDARGYEIVGATDRTSADPEDDGSFGDSEDAGEPDRLWLVQCKREKSLTPARMEKHLAEIADVEAATLYGIVFAVACDVSKATRDVFRAWCSRQGIPEAHIWSRSELEDQIFQPKNDGILFAYFGISLQIRRRTVKTAVRARLATKRRCEKVLSRGMTVLLRDPEDDRYPYRSENTRPEDRGWRISEIVDFHPRGIVLLSSRYFAYMADDGVGWDCLENFDDAVRGRYQDPWAEKFDEEAWHAERALILDVWSQLPDTNKAWCTGGFLVVYDDILAIDETGDEYARYPHIYLEKAARVKSVMGVENLSRHSPASCFAEEETRVTFFSDDLRSLRGHR